jgi:serine/threonine protein kinase/tetratricopeptide (TPR) repeat protein
MNLCGISDSVTSALRGPEPCPSCRSTSRVGRGLCLQCLLQTGFDSAETDGNDLAQLLDEIDVRDADWRLGNYQILEEIGRGGMGVIYRARQRHSRRIVALKRVLSYHADSRDTLVRFRREAEAAASLDHPNILPIYEVSESEDGLPYFSMKFAPGGSLLDAAPALREEPRRAVALIAKVARAVQYAHVQGILHRDLKPGNVLLDGRGEPLVSDFGLAKWLDTSSDLTRTLTIFGTPGYIAPEQAQGPAKNLAPSADVYSLGAILFDLLTGRPPFLGEHALAVIQQAAEKPAPKLRLLAPHLDRDLETICAKCLERDPRARYRSAGDLAEDLERWLEGRPITARPVSPPVRVWRWSKRNPLLAAVEVVAAAFALVSLGAAVKNVGFSQKLQTQEVLRHSVAVLPFLDLDRVSPDKSMLHAMVPALRSEMSQFGPTRVVGIAETEASAGIKETAQQANAKLNIRAVLTGTTRQINGKRRFAIQLIDAVQGHVLSAKILEVVSAHPIATVVCRPIARTIYPLLNNDDLSSVRSVERDAGLLNSATRDLILAGRELEDRRSALDIDRAIQCFEKAIALEPKSSVAHAYLALASIGRTSFVFNPQLLTTAETSAREALRLNPERSEAHRAMASVMEQKGDFSGAQEEVLQAVELDGLQERLASHLASIANSMGRPDRTLQWLEVARRAQAHPADYDHLVGDCLADLCEDVPAEAAYRRVVDLHPELPEGWIGICRLRLLQGDFDGARKIWLENQDRYKNFEFVREIGAQVEFFSRHFAEAERLYQELANRDPDGGGRFYGAVSYQSALGCVRVLKGDVMSGRAILIASLEKEREALRAAPGRADIRYRIAAIESSLGLKDLALDDLKAAVITAGWLDYRSAQLDPRFDSLKGDKAFAEIVTKMSEQVASLRNSLIAESKDN